MRRLRRLIGLAEILAEQREVIGIYKDIVAKQQHHANLTGLQHARELRAMAIAWRTHLEMPEIDMREDLSRMIRDLDGNIAVLEEHLV